jgi:hypothetical protein
MSEDKELTTGEKRVRTSFNPSKTETVDLVKQKTAELINLCEQIHHDASEKKCDEKEAYEVFRCAQNAMGAYEEAAMWAVKAATG